MITYTLSLMRIALLLVVFSLSDAAACLWDRDTLRDEITSKTSAYDLIVGQVAHHGAAYYEKRVESLGQKVSLDMGEKQDLAVAYIRLGDFVKGEEILRELYQSHPDEYSVNSNLAILYKKKGNYATAYSYMKRALEIKPEGHMGLGDWYLRRIGYDKVLLEKPIPKVNFLGEKYEDGQWNRTQKLKFDAEKQKRARYLTQLIFNDREFADAYLVLGDLLKEIGDKNLALRAYMRAKLLKHPNRKVVVARIDSVIQQFKLTKGARGKQDSEIIKFKKELEGAAEWRRDFEKAENELVNLTHFPSLAETESKMNSKRFYPIGK
ncbi:MAG: hypothetical protein QM496_13425 [Verrucomicrobiota bacterium]